METNFDNTVERLLDAPCWVVDVLPRRVPKSEAGRFFAVEQYFLLEPRHKHLCWQFSDVLLKLNCYYDMLVKRSSVKEWVKNPSPAMLVAWLAECLHHEHLCILVDDGDTLITVSGGDTHITLYNPSNDLLGLVQQLVTASGLFLWKPEENQ
ncbi:MAG: hypothetical protein IJK41_04955 [Muribaculaceae bacterium]|nr:hypothetical protein [Muribaculaceae bacterium]